MLNRYLFRTEVNIHWKIIFIVFLILFVSFENSKLTAEQKQYPNIPSAMTKSQLKALGVIAPDGKTRFVFPMKVMTAKRIKEELGVVYFKKGNIDFVRTKSWRGFSDIAKASTDDLTRTIADLISRVDSLEGRVRKLENK